MIVNGSLGTPPAARATVWKFQSRLSGGMATETLTSALLAYRDLAPIFMIRAVVKTWKTSYVINDAGGTNQLTASGCLEFGNQQFHK